MTTNTTSTFTVTNNNKNINVSTTKNPSFPPNVLNPDHHPPNVPPASPLLPLSHSRSLLEIMFSKHNQQVIKSSMALLLLLLLLPIPEKYSSMPITIIATPTQSLYITTNFPHLSLHGVVLLIILVLIMLLHHLLPFMFNNKHRMIII